MHVVFWSPVAGKTGATASLMAAALLAVYKYEKKVFLTQTHYGSSDLENRLFGREPKKELLQDIGMDAIFRLIRTGNMKQGESAHNFLKDYILSIGKGGLHLLPGTLKGYREALEEEMVTYLPIVYQCLNDSYDMMFTDTAHGCNPVSAMLWEEADVLVVTLSQNKDMIEKCLSHYQFPRKKTVFLIGGYQRDSIMNSKNLEKTYKELKGKLYTVPYQTAFMDAISESRCQEMFLKNLTLRNKADKGEFFDTVSKMTEMLISKAIDKGGTGLDT